MKTRQSTPILVVLLSGLVPLLAHASISGPYTSDANTLVLYHFDDAAGATSTANVGSAGHTAYAVLYNGVATPPTTNNTFGYSSYTGFGGAISNQPNCFVGLDWNNSGSYQADLSSGTLSADALGMTNLNIGKGGQTPFTIEALIRPTVTNVNQEIVCTDSSGGTRAFQFKINNAGQLQFQINLTAPLNAVAAIPSLPPHGFVAGNWYHVAATYDGTAVRLYWTLLDPSSTVANQIGSPTALAIGATQGAITGPLVVGNENRGAPGELFQGLIDEVRISNIARPASGMMFTYVPQTLTWAGTGPDWDLATANWTTDGNTSHTTYHESDNVIFDALGVGTQPTVNLTADRTPSSVVVNSASDYILGGGAIGGTATLTKSGGGTLTLASGNTYSGGTVISGGTVQVGNGGTTGGIGTGPILNNSALVFNVAPGVSPSGSIGGSGTLTQTGSGSVTLSVSNSYDGATFVNSGILYLQNNTGLGSTVGGTTVANGGELFIVGGTPSIGPEALSLSGTGAGGAGALHKGGASATSFGGAVTLTGDTFIDVDGGASLTLTNGAGIDGSAVNANLTVGGPGSGVIAGPLSLGLGALTVSAGNWSLASTGLLSGGVTVNGGIVNLGHSLALGTGTLSLMSAAQQVNFASGLAVTNAILLQPGTGSGIVAQGLLRGPLGSGSATLSGPISITANPASGGHFDGGNLTGGLVVNGPVTATPGAGLIVTHRVSRVTFSGGGSYEYFRGSGLTVLGANNGLATDAVVELGSSGAGTLDLAGFSQTLNGLQKSANAATVTNSGSANSTLTITGVSSNTTFAGTITDNGVSKVALTVAGGVFTLNGVETYSGNTLLSAGTLGIGGGGALAVTPLITVDGGATFDISAAGFTLGGSQVINGDGTVNGSLTVNGGIAPGTSIGTLTVNGNLTLNGVTSIEVNQALGTNDQLICFGSVSYGGRLDAQNLGGTLSIGDHFTIVSALGGASGHFTSITGSPGGANAWAFDPTTGVLSVVNGIPTTPTNITAQVSGNTLNLSWPPNYLGWTLQTNGVGLASPSAWYAYPGSASVTNIGIPIDPAQPHVFFRMIYQP